jgi:hypothetical protein
MRRHRMAALGHHFRFGSDETALFATIGVSPLRCKRTKNELATLRSLAEWSSSHFYPLWCTNLFNKLAVEIDVE